MKRDVAQLIAVKPGALEFLGRLRAAAKHSVLVTNAHRKSLSLKLEHTRLDAHIDRIVCAHDLGRPKEDPAFWAELQTTEPFDPQATLLIDDNIAALRSAQRYGIAHLMAVRQPSSQGPAAAPSEFAAVDDFFTLFN
jgi:putative hydrolase of the HAD superfamily